MPGTTFQRYGNGPTFYADSNNDNVDRTFIHDIFDTGLSNQYAGSSGIIDVRTGTAYVNQINISYTNNVIVNCGLASFEIYNAVNGSDGGLLQNISFVQNTSAYAGYGWGAPNTAQRAASPSQSSPNAGGANIGAHIAAPSAGGSYSQNNIQISDNIFYQANELFTFVYRTFNSAAQMHYDYNVYYQPNAGQDDASIFINYLNNDFANGGIYAYKYSQFSDWQTRGSTTGQDNGAGQDVHSKEANPLFAGNPADTVNNGTNQQWTDQTFVNRIVPP